MPAQKPGRSKQDYGTPRDFLDAVEARWGALQVDLAATPENAKAPLFFSSEQNSLRQDWTAAVEMADHHSPTSELCRRLWLNPPYEDIDPWAAKCANETERLPIGAQIFFLVPASIGSSWFAKHVHGRALVLALSPRLIFEGCTAPYPKDCILAVYGTAPSFDIWRWK